MSNSNRVNPITKELRVKQVISMLVIGKYRWEIVQEFSKLWKCSEANVDQYIADAKKLMKSHFKDETVEDILSKYNFLYNDALMSGDKKLAVKILDSIAKVGGYVTDKLQVSGELNHNVTVIKLIGPPTDNKEEGKE